MKKVLGLDASTSTIGIGIVEYSDKNNIILSHHEYYKPIKKDLHFIETLFHAKQHVLNIIDTHKPDYIAMEEFIPFMKGKSTAATTISLAIMNRTIGLAILEKTGNLPKMIYVQQVRSTLKLGKKMPPKEEMPEVVAHHLGIDFPYYKKISKKKEVLLVENGDVADAIAVALAYVKKHG